MLVGETLEIPEFLKRLDTPQTKAARAEVVKAHSKTTRLPPQAERRAKLTQKDLDAITEIASGAVAKKEAKTKVRIAKLVASKSGDAAKMPLQGKAALQAIAGPQASTGLEARTTSRGKKVTGKKEQALRDVRESEPSETLVQAVAGPAGNQSEGDAVGEPATPKTEEKTTVRTKKKKTTGTAASQNARTPVHNGNGHAKTKSEIVIELARRAHGCSLAEVLAATGWPAISMPQVFKSQGVKMRKEKKKGEVTRYFAA